MSKPNFNVRLSTEQLEALKRVADQNSVEVSQLIRWAVDALIRHAERHGGRLLLPIDFSETWEVFRRDQERGESLRVAEEPPKYKTGTSEEVPIKRKRA